MSNERSHRINWFEIPVNDLAAAGKLYAAMLGYELKHEVLFGIPHAILTAQGEGVTGTLPAKEPSACWFRVTSPAVTASAATVSCTYGRGCCSEPEVDRNSAANEAVAPATSVGYPLYVGGQPTTVVTLVKIN